MSVRRYRTTAITPTATVMVRNAVPPATQAARKMGMRRAGMRTVTRKNPLAINAGIVITQALTPSVENPPWPISAAWRNNPTGIARAAPAEDDADQPVQQQMHARRSETQVQQRSDEKGRGQ